MAYVDLPPEARRLLRALAGDPADSYLHQLTGVHLSRAWSLPVPSLSDARAGLLESRKCLQAMLGHYAFLRRGRDRQELGALALAALDEAERSADVPIIERSDGRSVWHCFEGLCDAAGRKPLRELNYGAVVGLVELAQEIHRQDGVGSIAQWIGDAAVRTGRIEAEFDRIVDIRGVGPKFASVFLRDVACLLDIEDTIAPVDRLYLQPIDKWVRLASPVILDAGSGGQGAAPNRDVGDGSGESRPDWVLAGKLSKHARIAGVQGTRLNMGLSWLGMREGKSPQGFTHHLRRLAQP